LKVFCGDDTMQGQWSQWAKAFVKLNTFLSQLLNDFKCSINKKK